MAHLIDPGGERDLIGIDPLVYREEVFAGEAETLGFCVGEGFTDLKLELDRESNEGRFWTCCRTC